MLDTPLDPAILPLASTSQGDTTPFEERWAFASDLFSTSDPTELIPAGVRLFVTLGVIDGVPCRDLDAVVARMLASPAIDRLCEVLGEKHHVRYSPAWLRKVSVAEANDASLTLSHADLNREWEYIKIDSFMWALLGLSPESAPTGD